MTRRAILLITSDTVGERMAGPGIRSWELGRVLSRDFDVTLAVPPFLRAVSHSIELDFPGRARVCQTTAQLRALVREADVILTQGAVVLLCPFLLRIKKPLVFDSYDPFLLASLHQVTDASMNERLAVLEKYRNAHLVALRAADFVVCASERQRDYFLGMLSALGRVNPMNHDEDPSFRRLVDVVPFGLPGEPPRRGMEVLKGVHPKIAVSDRVVLWGGGVWNWLDAKTAVRAMARIVKRRDDVRLFFMGTVRPNASVAQMSAIDETIALSQQLGLRDRVVFFHDWVPYAERENYLLEADIGLSLHRDVLETRFAFRTRLLDYMWAGLPIVASEGDVLSKYVRRWELGRVVAAGDDEAVADAICALLETPELKEVYGPRFDRLREDHRWENVAEPLVQFCHQPRLAPDKNFLRTLPHPSTRSARRLVLREISAALREYSTFGWIRRRAGSDGS
jgi:glycosyltransferase involved in cell wall biosynthesis